jgi:hypothetical protein
VKRSKNPFGSLFPASKKRYDHNINDHDYKIGDLVYVAEKASPRPGLTKKLSPNFKGPYEIIKINENQTVVIQIKKSKVTYHKNLIKPYFAGSDAR